MKSTAINSALTTNSAMTKTITYYVAFIGLGLLAASLGPTIPGLAENTGTQLSQISFLFTARSLGYLLGAQIGRVYDYVSGHLVMGSALLVMAVMAFLTPLISLLWLLAIVLLVLGLAEGALDVGGNTLLVWVHGRKVGPYMNALHFFFGVGAFLSPIIIAQAVLMSQNITLAYWILALLILPVGLWLLRLPSPAIEQASSHEFGARTNRLLVALLALFFFLFVGAEVSFGGWIFTYAVTLGITGATAAAYLTSVFWGALTLGRLLGIPIAARVRPRIILLGDLLGCLFSLAIILIWQGSSIAVWLGTFGMGVSMASLFPITISFAENRMAITGKITAWFLFGASIGGMIVPWAIGQFFDSVGAQVTMIIIFVDILLAVGVFTILMLYSRKLETETP